MRCTICAAIDSSLAPLPEVRYVEAQAKDGGIQFRASKLQTLAIIAAAGAARRIEQIARTALKT